MLSAQRGDLALTILDGGMGHLMRRNGVSIEGELGSVGRFSSVALRANVEHPDLVISAHLEFLRAGATVITTNSYGCIPRAWANENEIHKMPLALESYIRHAGENARCAVTNFLASMREIKERLGACHDGGGQGVSLNSVSCNPVDSTDIRIAGCVPPLSASYRADLVEHDTVLAAGYDLIVQEIAPYADLFLCETMSLIREAVAAASAVRRWNEADDQSMIEGGSTTARDKRAKKLWVSFTLQPLGEENHDVLLRSGESLRDAAVTMLGMGDPNLAAILVNCSDVSVTTEAVRVLATVLSDAQRNDIQIGAYANAFPEDDEKRLKEESNEACADHADYSEHCAQWRRDGASVIGGCCMVYPEDIRGLVKALSHSAQAG